MRVEALKVGELARRTGLTVRTLHHYDEVGLLRPSLHTEAGHRLYTVRDVARLQQVLSLRALGFSLEQTRDCLEDADFSPLEVIHLHIARLRRQIEQGRQLCERLEGLAAHFSEAEEVSAEEFLQTIEVMTMIENLKTLIENYYTAEQLEHLKKRREEAGPAGEAVAQQGQADWAALIEAFRLEMERGTDPSDPKAQALGKRRQILVDAFTGGDKGIEQSLKRMWTEQGDKLAAQFGYDPKVLAYIAKVDEAGKGPS
jgi:DNA-binding transcriptional MerR regulator